MAKAPSQVNDVRMFLLSSIFSNNEKIQYLLWEIYKSILKILNVFLYFFNHSLGALIAVLINEDGFNEDAVNDAFEVKPFPVPSPSCLSSLLLTHLYS